MESPDTIQGRMKEGAHLAGYSLQRSMENLRWLLEDSRYKQLSPGYNSVNDFLRDTKESFVLLNINPEERKQIAELVKELQPQASQRAIADMVGVSNKTIGADLGEEYSSSIIPPDDKKQLEIEEYSSPIIPPDNFDPIEQERKERQHEEDKPHVANNSGNNEWYTPPEYIEAARAVMGGIDLDPASSPIANKTIGASVYFTSEDDGLRFHWSGRVWMNPPYSSELIGKFCDKLAQHFAQGDITDAIVLVNNATETGWFQSLLVQASAVCFVKRRIKYLDEESNPVNSPLQGQAILYLGDDIRAFTEYFAPFGAMLYGG